MKQSVLIATPLPHRQRWYREVLEKQGLFVVTAQNGIECIEQVRRFHPEILILETDLLWGGAEGVLALCESEHCLEAMAVIAIDRGNNSDQTYRLGAWSLADYWRRYPKANELCDAIQAIGACATNRAPFS
jgi:DNA-binding NtrC family response regulator